MSRLRHPMRWRRGIGVEVVIPTTTNCFPVTLVGRDIKVVLRDPAGREVPVDSVSVAENVVSFVFAAFDQKYLGRWSVSVYENKGKADQNIVDRDWFIELVESTELADECCCEKLVLPCGNFNSRVLDVADVWCGASDGVPTDIDGTKKGLANGVALQVSTDSSEKKKCHWVAVKSADAGGVSVQSWKDVDNDSVLDMVQTVVVGEYKVWYYLSSGYISNVSNVVMSVGGSN